MEEIILENGAWGARSKTALTSTHINFYKKEGWLSSNWVISGQIPLVLISEAYVDTSGTLVQSSKVKLKMKNGEIYDLALTLSDGDNMGLMFAENDATQWAVRTKTLSDRWVNAINQQLGKNAKIEIDMLKERIRQLEDSQKK
jgi:hypothetical protein